MGVRKVDLTTDEVEYDSRIGVVPTWKNAEKPDEVPDIDLEEVELDNRVPGLQEIQPEQWINPLHPDKMEKIVLDDEALAKLRDVIGNYNGWDEENQ